ncbi:MAG: nuclear transport factor 2 family protein [Thaumarchaeota archaeon]|nr:nuclear transport factor 2 family protein [Nitrososphaerota archaeon]
MLENAKTWCNSWTAHDLDAVMKHYAENVQFSSPMVPRMLGIESEFINGKEKLREYFEICIKKYHDLRLDFVDVLVGVNGVVVLYYRETGALASDISEMDNHNKIVSSQVYYNIGKILG